MNLQLCFIVLVYFSTEISGHGMMIQPPGRSSIWRSYNDLAPQNYNDNELFCGGYYVQHELNGGKCGVCGDRYDDPHPQANENTGTYGKGILVAHYEPGEVINVTVLITANHLGSFTFSLCELEDPYTFESGEECFQPLLLEDGTDKVLVGAKDYQIYSRIALPNKTCDRCVLRWTYQTGNNWGVCADGEGKVGCGPQEHFRSCADIRIE